MPDWLFAAYVGIGAFGGLCAGLFGIGGGALFGPLLLLLAVERGIPTEQAVAAAVATSIATVILTSIPSALVHSLQGTVAWRQLRYLAPAAALGAAAGAALVPRLEPKIPVLLMLILLLVGIRNLWARPGAAADGTSPEAGRGFLSAVGATAGTLGALTGTGGGLITVPMLMRAGGGLQKAIGTSAAVTMLVALGASGVFAGEGVDLPALIGVAIGCIACAALGARLAGRLDARIIRWLFGVFMIAICLRLGYWLFAPMLAAG